MAVNLYTFVDLFSRATDTASHLLEKGCAYAAECGVAEDEMLQWRLIADMNPLSFQLMVVANFACQWPARVAGLPVPESAGPEMDVAGLKRALARSKAYLSDLSPAQFTGRDDVSLSFPIGPMEPTMPAAQWLSVFATTNLFFHLSTAYAILRAKGAPLGKADVFGGRL